MQLLTRNGITQMVFLQLALDNGTYFPEKYILYIYILKEHITNADTD
jgi:hypothetical protein